MKHRDASVQVRETWDVVEELDFPRMSKLLLPDIGEGQDLYVQLNTEKTEIFNHLIMAILLLINHLGLLEPAQEMWFQV